MRLYTAGPFFAGPGLLLVATLSSVVLALQVPPLRGRVNDYAGMVPPDKAQQLEERLAAFEKETSHQVTVLTIPSLEGDSIEDFSIRVAESWKIGQKGFDNGAILLIAQKDRKLRIEVGYGLEGVLPDVIASRIIREVIVLRFRDGDFDGGIQAGVDAIMKVVQGEKLPDDRAHRKPTNSAGGLLGLLLVFLLFLPFLIMRLIVVPGSRARGTFVGGAMGIAIGGIASILTLLAGAPVGFVAIILILLATVGLGVLGGLQSSLGSSRVFGSRGSAGWREPFYSDPDEFRGGRWGGGFGGGGFGGSGGGGSGGFSGGGGGFGGGGASGGW
jgi:uncharacterized protein